MADKIFHTGFNQKTNPVGADKVMISDSEASNETKYTELNNIPISIATQTALDTKVDNVIAGTNTTVSRSGNTITVNSLGGPAVVTDGFNRNYFVATEGQTEFTANFDFTENTGSVIVALNGQILKPTLDYTEPGLNKVVFVSGLNAGDEVQLLTGIKGEKGDKGDKGDDGADGTGAGDMLKSENLSGLANYATARTNLGLDTTANQTDSTDKRFMTDAQEAKLDDITGTNTGDQTVTTGTVTATGGQTVVTVGTYVIGNNKLQVFVNGLEQLLTTDYTETSTTSITFTSGLTVEI